MASHTQFAGLTALDPGEATSDDGGSFLWRNPEVIDTLLRLGGVTHRHDAAPALADPTADPIVTIAPTGGTIPVNTDIYIGYTLFDARYGETLLNDNTILVTSSGGITAPIAAPSGVVDYTAGALLAATYQYAATVTDGLGGETTISPFASVTVDPGYASAQIHISELSFLLSSTGGTTWRLWRSTNASTWFLMDEGTADTFLDDGTVGGDCTVAPPDTGTVADTSLLSITVPAPSGASSGAVRFSVYASPDGSFTSPCLLGNYPIDLVGVQMDYPSLGVITTGSPPFVSLAWPGASQIDPDTELVQWYWKRPVATFASLPGSGQVGDIRATIDSRVLYMWDGANWDSFASILGGHVIQDHGVDMTQRDRLDFIGVGVKLSDGGSKSIVSVDVEARIPIAASGTASAGVFGSGWTNQTSMLECAYFRDVSAFVCLEGAATSSITPTPGDVIAKLPLPGYGPPGLETFMVVTGDDSVARASGCVDLDSSGNVIWQAGATGAHPWVSLAGVGFRP